MNTPLLSAQAHIDHDWCARLGLGEIARKLENGQRLSVEDGLALYACPEPTAVGHLAHFKRLALHGLQTLYVVNRHINYSNVCVNRCRFCAFRRDEGASGAFTQTMDEMLAKVDELPKDVAEIHIVGGCHPELTLGFFQDLLSRMRELRPGAALKCFTAVEIAHFAAMEGIGPREALVRLRDAGLAMLPGGGAEIFAPHIRQATCPEKLSGKEWLNIHRTAHELGLPSNATILFGMGEELRDRLEHLDALRRLQDDTGGFTCFIPLPFLPGTGEFRRHGPGGLDILKTIAVSRLMLDNIPHIKSYWVMLGVLPAQVALTFGANDLDGTVVEEKIGHMAGADSAQAMTRNELTAMIRGCGLTPVERDGLFRPRNGEAA